MISGKKLLLFLLLSMGIVYACSKKGSRSRVAGRGYAVMDAGSQPIAGARMYKVEYTH